MINKFDELFSELKEFVTANSLYQPRVVKNYTSTSTYFPIISCLLNNMTDTDYCTLDMIEKHHELYLTIDVYTKNKIDNEDEIASQLINDELTNLVIKFFSAKNLKMTLCRLTPNADTSITRRTIQYQCLVSSARGNITRR